MVNQKRVNIKKNMKKTILSMAVIAGLFSAAIPSAAFAEEGGPGVGLTTNNGSTNEANGGPSANQNQTTSRPISENAFKKINGQYVNMYGDPVSGAIERGISVAKYQGDIDWNRVAADDISFTFVRIGYLDSPDPYFDKNMREAAASGVKTGVYIFSEAKDVATAEAEARYAVRMAKEYKISYPIAMDVESKNIGDISKQELTDIINAFCKVVEESGFYPIVYSYHNWLENRMDTSQIPYDIWYARYGENHEYRNRTIWQGTETGHVNGIQGNVCIELAFKDYTQAIPADSWKCIDGNWYYFRNYQKATGWLQIDGKQYYLDPQNDGIMAANTTLTIDGTSYTFGSDGVMQ